MIARIEYPSLDAGPYLDQLDAIGAKRGAAWPKRGHRMPGDDAPPNVDADGYARVMALNDYLFGELRFVGNDRHYEDPRNSFLNEVIDRRTGIPITLALVYMEVARRAGLHVEGINFPGHFLVRCPARRGLSRTPEDDLIIDAFHGGALLSEDACRTMLRRHAIDGRETTRQMPSIRALFARATKPQILLRMLLNLKRIYVQMHSFPQARDITELLLAVDPSAINELRDRGLLAYHLNDFSGALRDLQAYLQLLVRRPSSTPRSGRSTSRSGSTSRRSASAWPRSTDATPRLHDHVPIRASLTMATRANNFDALRLLGALLVAVGHSMDIFTGRDWLGAATSNQSLGGLGLNIFCVISGYLITKSRLRNDAGDFAVSRALRILPALAGRHAAHGLRDGPARHGVATWRVCGVGTDLALPDERAGLSVESRAARRLRRHPV